MPTRTRSKPIVMTQPRPAATRSPTTPTVIAERIMDAIVAGKLPAGTKLGEVQIGSAFNVSRNVVRESLKLLQDIGVADIIPNRGAFVARPSPKDAEDAYSARRLIENALIAEVARSCSSADIRALRQHVAEERAAEKAGRRRELIRLLGEFHLLVGRIAGNAVLYNFLTKLIPQTAILLVLYEDPDHRCAVDEHARLVELIAKGDENACCKLMERHLSTNRNSLQFTKKATVEIDLIAVLKAESSSAR